MRTGGGIGGWDSWGGGGGGQGLGDGGGRVNRGQISLVGPDPLRYCASARERVWELARLLLCNIRGNAGLGVSQHPFVVGQVQPDVVWRCAKKAQGSKQLP